MTQSFDGFCLNGRKHRWHEQINGARVDDCIGDLVLFGRNQAAPNRVSFGPDIFAFVVKPFCIFVHNNRKGHTIQTRNNATIIFRGAPINCHRVALGWITNAFNILIQQILQNNTAVIGCSADQKILGRWAPCTCQPINIGLKPTRCGNNGAGFEHLFHTCDRCTDLCDLVSIAFQMVNMRLISNVDTQVFSSAIKRIYQCFTPTKEKRIRAPKG